MLKLHTNIIVSDNSSVVAFPLDLTLEQIAMAQSLRYNSNEFNGWLPQQNADIRVEEILIYIKQEATIDDAGNWVFNIVADLEETQQNELPIYQFSIEDVGYVVMGFDESLVDKETKAVIKEIKNY